MEHSTDDTQSPPATGPDGVVPEPRENAQDPFERLTADVVARWVAAWTTGRTAGLFRLLAADATIESNLDPDGDFIEILTDFVDAVQSISAPTAVVKPGRAVLLYDCAAAGETFRLAETLVVDSAGLVREVRRVYDLAAVDRLLPGLVEQF